VIQSIDRAIRVLFALQGARRMTLSDLAGHLELAPSTVHGIVRTLVAQGMVVQEHRSGRYQLGPAVLRLGNVYLDTLELRSKAIPWAEDLARRTGYSVRTGVLLLKRPGQSHPRLRRRSRIPHARGLKPAEHDRRDHHQPN
jgi:DNA-binding IclR family transcriptional regulator